MIAYNRESGFRNLKHNVLRGLDPIACWIVEDGSLVATTGVVTQIGWAVW